MHAAHYQTSTEIERLLYSYNVYAFVTDLFFLADILTKLSLSGCLVKSGVRAVCLTSELGLPSYSREPLLTNLPLFVFRSYRLIKVCVLSNSIQRRSTHFFTVKMSLSSIGKHHSRLPIPLVLKSPEPKYILGQNNSVFHVQYLLMPKIRTPCSCGSLGISTLKREAVFMKQ